MVSGLSAVDKIISGSCLFTSEARSSPSPAILIQVYDAVGFVRCLNKELQCGALQLKLYFEYFYTEVGRQKSVGEQLRSLSSEL